jgi:conjugative transfer signal peptidase TraF
VALSAAVGILFWGASTLGIRVNASPPLPIGLYQAVSGTHAALVEFCPAEPFASLANARGYRQVGTCPDGGSAPMKPVVAPSGDSVRVSGRGLSLNGKTILNSTPLLTDTAGRPLTPWPVGTYRVQAGTVWVVSRYHNRLRPFFVL